MRAFAIGLCGILVVCGIVAFGQGKAGKRGGEVRDTPAPTHETASWSMAEMKAVAQELAASKETTHRFFGEKGYNMEVRRLVGPQPILQHSKKSDFMVIQDGEGTFTSGGELVNAKAGGGDVGHGDGLGICAAHCGPSAARGLSPTEQPPAAKRQVPMWTSTDRCRCRRSA